MSVTVRQLAKMVAESRKAQRKYYKERTSESLDRAIKLERKLDAVVKEILEEAALPLLYPEHDAQEPAAGPKGAGGKEDASGDPDWY